MAAWQIDLLDGANVPVGFGPILTAQHFATEAKLDAAGAVSFSMPRADPASDLVAERQAIRCSTVRGGVWTVIGTGVVETLTEDYQADQTPRLEVGAADSLIALADRTVGNLTLASGAGGQDPMPAASLLPAIAAFAPPGWTFNGTPSEPVYLALSGESVLAALGKLAAQLGDHFRLDPNLTVTWLPKTTAPPASGLRATGAIPNPNALGGDTCLITRIHRKRDASKQASRVYAYGGGNAVARTTLSSSSSSYVAPTYALPAGYSYGYDATLKAAYIKHDAADAAHRIDSIQTFDDVAAAATGTAHALSATNALAQTAVTWLARHVDVYYSYDLEVTAVQQAIVPGQTIRVVSDQMLAGRRIPLVDGDLLVLGVKTSVDAEGTARIVSFTLANSDRWPEDDTTLTAGNATRTQSQSAHLQVAERALTAESAASVSTVLDAAHGGTGQSVYTIGDLLYASGAASLSTLQDVAAGQVLRSGGVGVAPAWGALTTADMAALYSAGAPFTVPQSITVTDAGTNTAPGIQTFSHRSTGTPAAGFGGTMNFQADSSTNVLRVLAQFLWTWIDATEATRKAQLVFNVLDTGTRRALMLGTDGTQALLGFYNVAAVARPAAYVQTYATAARTLAAYTPNPQNTAYTGATDGEAKLVDLNALRVAVENLRAHHESLAQVVNSVVDDFQLNGLLR